jgi:hypothetical protein
VHHAKVVCIKILQSRRMGKAVPNLTVVLPVVTYMLRDFVSMYKYFTIY